MLAFRLFFDRLMKYWRFQAGVFFSVVDWVVALYFVVPGLLIAGYHYIQLGQGSYTWPAQISYPAILLFLFLWTLLGRFHLFVEEADQLLLRQRWSIFRGIQYYGILYSSFSAFLGTLFLFFLLWPILIGYLQLSFGGIVLLFCLTYSSKLLHYVYKLYYYLPYKRWKKWLLTGCIFAIDTGFYFGFGLLIGSWGAQNSQSALNSYFTGFLSTDSAVFEYHSLGFLENENITMVLLLTAMFLIYYAPVFVLVRKRTSLTWSFSFDCARELEAKYRSVDMLLNQSMHIGAPSFRVQKRRKSRSTSLQLILPSRKIESRNKANRPQRVIFSLFYRFIVRNRGRLFDILRLTGVFITAISLTPGFFKWGMWLLGIGVFVLHQRDIWRQWIQHDYIQLFNRGLTIKKKDAAQAIFISTSPSIALISLSLGAILFSLWTGLLLIIVGLLLSFILACGINLEFERIQSR